MHARNWPLLFFVTFAGDNIAPFWKDTSCFRTLYVWKLSNGSHVYDHLEITNKSESNSDNASSENICAN